MTIQEHLIFIKACPGALRWVKNNNLQTGQECWDKTNRIDWLFWWAAKTGQSEKVVKCARLIAGSVTHLKNSYADTAAGYADAAADAAAAAYADAAAAYADAAADAAAAGYADAAADAAADADAAAEYAAAYAADYAAAYAADYTAAADAAAAAYRKQKQLNLKITRENLVCPFPG